MKRLTSFFLLVLMLVQVPAEAKPRKKQTAAQLSTIEMIEKVNNHWQQTHKAETRAFWDDAAYHTGNMEAFRLLGKAGWREYSDKWARHNKWSGATGTDKQMWLTSYQKYGEDKDHVLFADWQICFQTYLDLYETNPDDYKLARVRDVMNFQLNTTQTDYWWWIDATYMAMPVFAKLYRQTGNTEWLDKMTVCFRFADKLMWDESDHLYYRDGKYIYPKHKTNNGQKDFWARGNGWALAALARVLADIPHDYAHRAFFVDRFQALADAVARCQQKDGYWTRSMLDAKQAEGPETSGTAFFCYGLLWGMNNGLLDRVQYEPVAQKAWQYLSMRALQPDGSVGYVQPIGEKAIPGQQLAATSTANFGTGAFLLAACEKVRFDDNKGDTSFTFVVHNESDEFRQQLVELDAKTVFARLGISGGRQFRVMNALKQEVAYQLTHDGKVLVEASVRPRGAAVFTVSKGQPRPVVNVAYGRMYPERVDDIAWENDRAAYRCYGPSLQKSGERAFGNDVWTKNAPDLEVEKRYFVEDQGKAVVAALKKSGDMAAAHAMEEKTTYHYDHGHGLDCYKVGPSLGAGAPALMDGEDIIFPYCWKEYELLDNGPLRFTVKLVYNPTDYKGTQLTEHRLLSLDKGSNFNKTVVCYAGAEGTQIDVASGVVIHNEDTQSVRLGSDYVQYADPTDNPNGQNFQIYVGAIFPDGVGQTLQVANPGAANGIAGHALGICHATVANTPFTYYWGSAWSKYDCRNQDEWQQRIDAFKRQLASPLRVEIK